MAGSAGHLPRGQSLYILLCIWGFGTAVLSSTTDVPSPRYMVPALFAFAVPFGLGFDVLKYGFRPVALGFALLFPILTAGNQFRQALAYQQNFYEASDALEVVRMKMAEGYRFCLTGQDSDIPLENQGAFVHFFEKFGPYAYGQERATVFTNVVRSGLPAPKAVLLARYSPGQLLAAGIPGLSLSQIRRVYVIRRDGYGLIESMSMLFDRLDRTLTGSISTTYDTGAPVVTSTPSFHIYLIDSRYTDQAYGDTSSDAKPTSPKARFANFTTGVSESNLLLPSKTYEFLTGPNEVAKLQIPLENLHSAADLLLTGTYRVVKGEVIFGITDDNGNDLWNTKLSRQEAWKTLPSLPPVVFPSGRPYYLFFYSHDRDGVIYSVRDIQIKTSGRLTELPGMRRFGALGW